MVASGPLVGFFVKEVLGKLGKEALEDYVKDFFKQCITDFKDRIGDREKKHLEKATADAIKEFLDLVEQELELAEFNQNKIQEYIKPFKLFLKNKLVSQALGSPFQKDIKVLETKKLVTIWNQINPYSPVLPRTFNWEDIATHYLKKVKRIRLKSNELQKILDSENLDKLANQNYEIRPNFDLKKHQEGIREEYGNLKLESLDTSGYGYNELKLWGMFIPQNVRESQEFMPQVYEIPKEYIQRLKETEQLEIEFSPEQLQTVRRRYLEQPVRSVIELIENTNYKYLVILGDPGSGKSTLLQYIALEWAELPLRDLPLKPIPLLIELRTYVRNHETNKCKNFLDFLEKGSGVTCHLPQQELDAKLQNGDAIVMFDGLDEVFDPAKRKEIISDIHRFT
ncbi:MAG: NACHT domain-containing protein, partial [Trichodesmium sp. St7_bin2_1]|nr:NACHT domain-containing protein [Trichodesmium sp. St7_bin2_1]